MIKINKGKKKGILIQKKQVKMCRKNIFRVIRNMKARQNLKSLDQMKSYTTTRLYPLHFLERTGLDPRPRDERANVNLGVSDRLFKIHWQCTPKK